MQQLQPLLSASVFRRGQKREFAGDVAPPGNTDADGAAKRTKGEDDESSDAADEDEVVTLQELQEVLSAPRQGKDYSAAIWRPHLQAAELVKARKGTGAANGFSWRRKQYLHVEEAVFLVDRGDLMLFVEHQGQQRLLSVQESYDLMVTSGVSMERYLVYSQLSRCGYLVMRHPSCWVVDAQAHPADVWQGWTNDTPPHAACHGKTLDSDPGPEGLVGGGRCTPASGEAAAAAETGRSGQQQQQQQQQQQLQWIQQAPPGGTLPSASMGLQQQLQPQQQQPQSQQQQPQPSQRQRHRGWWQACGPEHPFLQGIPSSWFEAAPRHGVESLPAALKAKHPRLKPLQSIPAGPHLAESRDNRGKLVYDVYSPGARVARNKGVYPPILYHLALCSGTPPTLQELWHAESQAIQAAGAPTTSTADASIRAGAETKPGAHVGRRHAPVAWASVADAILTFFQIGRANLLPLV